MRTEARGHSAYYFFIVIVIRYETTATARWALPLIVRTLFNGAITVAVWTCFHVCLPANTSASLDASSCYALSVEANIFAIILLVGAQGLEPWTR